MSCADSEGDLNENNTAGSLLKPSHSLQFLFFLITGIIMSDTSYSVYLARDMKVQWAKRQSNLQRKENCSLVCAGKEVRMKREP